MKAFDKERADEAIKGVIGLYAELGLTIAEACHVSHVVDETMRAEYPEPYRLMNELKG